MESLVLMPRLPCGLWRLYVGGKDAGKVLEGHLYPVTPRAFLARLVTPHHKALSSSPWRSQHGHHASITHLLADRESNGRIRRRAATHHAPRRVSALSTAPHGVQYLVLDTFLLMFVYCVTSRSSSQLSWRRQDDSTNQYAEEPRRLAHRRACQ